VGGHASQPVLSNERSMVFSWGDPHFLVVDSQSKLNAVG
jgi:hypothetical protein